MKFHPEREALTLELHDRPFRPMSAPLRVSHLAIATGERGGEHDHAASRAAPRCVVIVPSRPRGMRHAQACARVFETIACHHATHG